MDVPADTPLTIPVEATVATKGDTELHTPPATRSERCVVPVLHKTAVPVMVPAETAGFTVTTRLAVAVPQLFDTL